MNLQAPFPWFGGKSRAASLVWERLGDVANYVEPFAGSMAVLLGRPHEAHTETVNDLDGFIANFWRAIQADPEAVAKWADNPVNECDLHARHVWLVARTQDLADHLMGDPDYYDAKIAGWWVWGLCCWIGGGWCSGKGPWTSVDGLFVNGHLGSAGQGNRQLPHLGNAGQGVNRQLPHLGNAGQGVNRQLPHLGNAGQGVNRKRPHLGNAGQGVNRKRPHLGDGRGGLVEWMHELSARLSRVRVCCGDWSRVCGSSPTYRLGLTGVFLDPPYDHAERDATLYNHEMPVATEVRDWAVAEGSNPLMRIALCGYDGEHAMPDDWVEVEWKAQGGYGSRSADGSQAHRERIWFSPHCLRPVVPQRRMFG